MEGQAAPMRLMISPPAGFFASLVENFVGFGRMMRIVLKNLDNALGTGNLKQQREKEKLRLKERQLKDRQPNDVTSASLTKK